MPVAAAISSPGPLGAPTSGRTEVIRTGPGATTASPGSTTPVSVTPSARCQRLTAAPVAAVNRVSR